MVERVHRLLAGAALHVPARSPLCDRDAEVQSHPAVDARGRGGDWRAVRRYLSRGLAWRLPALRAHHPDLRPPAAEPDRKSTRLNSSHTVISYAVFCLKKKNADY